MEQVVEMFIEKQRQRLADGKIRQEEYEAFLDGINDALSFLGMHYVNGSETVEQDDRKPATFNEIEEKYKKFREVAMYKNSFLRVSDIIKHSGQMTDELKKITNTVKEEL
ncbi:hypothetical protein JZO77_15105 [Enterococcus hulanensis]|uniref:Uncharacterized protein n=1 Tax=Enterococcus hulanensis TaxID=2559929 RepID=A0ABU3EVN9_9ENTE|nr:MULTISPECIES: hypothetical protein [Enterococcus]MBO0411048.1 hypothetical protein [Enterococcus hulanensis]MBO0458064.1 hypothetical protein [Enterococcus hulanensis]MBX8937862.1 hypothetical protein [Enterococcus gilvus]MDT2598928.1 hypothetical protein [Enterococcus hulanensis]MDT2610579.1 hypothetical protein [Enterococcus hulanensis]